MKKSLAKLAIPASKKFEFNQSTANSEMSLTVKQGAVPEVQTVVYIHGIGNKPSGSVLKCQWDSALFGVSMGDRSRMAYWVNREYYPQALNDTCASGDTVSVDDDEVTTKAMMALALARPSDEADAIAAEIEALTDDPARQEWLRKMTLSMQEAGNIEVGEETVGSLRATDVQAKILFLPPFLRKLITQKITRAFLRDVNDFFFHEDRRLAMQNSLLERLSGGGGPFVVIAHSQGSMIAYDVLRKLSRTECDVRLFVTIGSPLGIDEVQDVFKSWVNKPKLPFPACVTRWVNVADRFDPVAIDNNIANDFEGQIENHSGPFLNLDSPRHPHSGTGYLRTSAVQNAVRETVGNAFGQATGRMIVARDLVDDMESGREGDRHEVLIQVQAPESNNFADLPDLDAQRAAIVSEIESLIAAKHQTSDVAELEILKRFVAAKLTRLEIETLRTKFADLKIDRIWRDSSKKALIYQSTHTVQARPANLGYGALGRNIGWAVLDTGIYAGHPHFQKFNNVKRQWDCTQRGAPVECDEEASKTLDGHGHGTHVAGVIAGQYEVPLQPYETPEMFAGMAPATNLYGFKVLDNQGNGQDSWTIKALDLIGDINEAAGKLVIQGINVSLGGSFDPSVYNCGHTPLCQEMRRLWRQGVLICLAAGNEGYAMLQSVNGTVPANLDLTIGDPANLEEAIAVGSVHKTNPHIYGVSYFSSRGPTADGRTKPDLVAPGEQILSANYQFNQDKDSADWIASDLYIEMSGTSMATPHVSGVLAAFLSRHQGFVGFPERVKALLLDNCTDLGRDRYVQGHGMPNLIKMLSNT